MAKTTNPTSKKTTETHDHAGHDHDHAHNEVPSMIGQNTVVKITIAWKDVKPAYEKAKGQIAKQVRTDGFRPGKVPAQLAENIAGKEKIIDEALQTVLPDAYKAAITKENKQPLTYPEFSPVSVEVGKDWEIEAHIAERPEITLKDYKKTAKDAIKTANKKLADVEEKNKKDSKAEKSDKKAEGTKEAISSELSKEQKEDFLLQHIYQALVQEYKPAVPDLLVKHEVQADAEQLSKQLQQVKLTFDEYLERRGVTSEQLSQELTLGALGKLQVAFIMDAIAQSAKISIDDKELDAYIGTKVDDQIKTEFSKNPEYRRLLANTLLRQKIADHLLAV